MGTGVFVELDVRTNNDVVKLCGLAGEGGIDYKTYECVPRRVKSIERNASHCLISDNARTGRCRRGNCVNLASGPRITVRQAKPNPVIIIIISLLAQKHGYAFDKTTARR